MVFWMPICLIFLAADRWGILLLYYLFSGQEMWKMAGKNKAPWRKAQKRAIPPGGFLRPIYL